jgi:methyl-accepting chemotaxis protein
MNKLANLSIGARLGAAFGTLIVLMVAIVATARGGMDQVGDDIHLLLTDRYVKVKLADEIADSLHQQARSARNILLFDNPAQREDEARTILESRERMAEAYKKLEPMLTTEQGKALFAKLMTERTDYVTSIDPFLAKARAGDLAGARTQLFEKVRPQQLEYMKSLDQFTAFQEKLMDETGAAAEAHVARNSRVMVIAAALGVLLAAGAGWLVTRSVTRPVSGVVDSLRAVAGGDLTVDVQVTRGDEVGQLQRALSDTVAALRRVVGEVRAGVDSVTTASGQIAAGNQDLSSRTEQQASNLQETASSMEQLTATVKQSADNAQQANQLAAAASGAAGRGGQVVGQVVGTMDEISASSKKIAEIIGTIDGIAFQTNILALNAAVEAARAGEQGRGFAVVAGEVRSLAQRSAEAAKEIKSLIGASVEKVESGARQVGEAGRAMDEIVSQVRKVSDLIGEIASGAQEQSSGIGQVNQAVSQMDQVTQQNAALVEESAAAAGSMAQQARKLAEAVAVFKLAQGAVATHTPLRSAPVAPAAPVKPRATPTQEVADKEWTQF